MLRFPGLSRGQFGIVTAGVLMGLAGCGHVSREDFDAEMQQVRAEIRTGDEQVAASVTTTNTRIATLETRLDTRIAALEGGLRTLEGEFEVVVERLETAIRFNAPVHFAYDEAVVRDIDQPLLDRFAGVVQEFYGDALVTVEGFTDPSGSAEYNLRLGQARADAVKGYLETAGLSADQIRAVSYGSSRDRQVVVGAQGPGENGWQNRRVAMVIDFGSMANANEMTPSPAEGLDP